MGSKGTELSPCDTKSINGYEEEVVYKPTTKDESKGGYFVYIAAFTGNLITFTAGLSFTWTSPVFPKMALNDTTINPLSEPLTPSQESWIASLLCLGAAIGPLFAGVLSDKIGRKTTLLGITVPVILLYVMMAYSSSVKSFYLARTLMGVSIGGVYAVMPMYLGEISEDHNRGTIGCLIGVFVSLGVLFPFVVGPYLSIKLFCFACAIPPILFLILFGFFIPESPHYLASKGDIKAAEEALQKLRQKSSKHVQKELKEITSNIEESNSNQGGVKDLFIMPGLRRGLIAILGVVTIQQLSGINIVLSFLQTIFESTGSGIPSDVSTIIIGLVQCCTTILTSFLVEKLGRKLLLIVSILGSSVSIIGLGIYFYLMESGANVQSIYWVPVVCLIAYIFTFNLGIGPLPWAVLGEMFPSHVKAVAGTLASFVCFMAGFLITVIYPFMKVLLGTPLCFALFGTFCFGGAIFIYYYLPETKGRSVAEIQEILSNR